MATCDPGDSIAPVVRREPVCVFLDNARPTREQHRSLLFIRPRKILSCRDPEGVLPLLDAIARESRSSWVAGYFSYEAAYALEEKLTRGGAGTRSGNADLAWFGVFDEPFIFDHRTGAWNRRPPVPDSSRAAPCRGPENKAAITVSRAITRRGYARIIRAIRSLIAAGDVYQVNFTYDTAVRAGRSVPAWNLYRRLREKQPVPFGAFIETGRLTIASFSPELFFMKTGQRLVVRPMKGTAPRGRCAREDAQIARDLARDEKNRSENIMIVDLLRNDLGKICVTGSVRTSALFSVERHPTVHQMTSTVSGTLRGGTSFAEIVRALFPSGSVTGAPKIRAMEIIREFETGPRSAYCGAIGCVSPAGDAVFSVPIRTLQRRRGEAAWRFRVGSGVVADSSADAEWRECLDKCDFLTRETKPFRLFESMLYSNGAARFLRGHKERLFESARYFDVPADRSAWTETIAAVEKRLARTPGRFKVRIFLDKTGTFSWDLSPVEPGECGRLPAAALSAEPVDPADPFLYHKTTNRPWYEAAAKRIRAEGLFDVIHVNRGGELTEGSRSNLFIALSGRLYTPPVSCGLLPGILRRRLLATGRCRERVLFPGDLKSADAIYCGNSVRGMVAVTVRNPASS